MGLQQSLQKKKDLRGQLRTKQKDKIKSSGAVYEVDCNNYFKKYTGETGRKSKEIMKENKVDAEKLREYEKITDLSQYMKTTGHPPAWDDVRIIYRENNWKKGKFKEAPRITSQNKEQLMNKKGERKTSSNLWNIILNDKT